jgi:hypothetical protein
MQPSTDAKIDPLTMWYRADEYMAAIDRYLVMVNERDKYKRACEKVMALWNAPDDHLPADLDLENVPMRLGGVRVSGEPIVLDDPGPTEPLTDEQKAKLSAWFDANFGVHTEGDPSIIISSSPIRMHEDDIK